MALRILQPRSPLAVHAAATARVKSYVSVCAYARALATPRQRLHAAAATHTPLRHARSLSLLSSRSCSSSSVVSGSVPLQSSEQLSASLPQSSDDGDGERIISALVVNRPGTLAQIADVFGDADQNISGLCVRSTVVPELSRVTITCCMREHELMRVKKRLRALVAVTFFHVTSTASCVASQELLLRSHALVQVGRDDSRRAALLAVLDAFGAEVVLGQDSAVIPEDGLSLVDTEELQYDKVLAASTTSGDEHDGERSGDGVTSGVSSDTKRDRTKTGGTSGFGINVGTKTDATTTTSNDSLFLHVVHEPAQLEAFTRALLVAGLRVLEVQTCGPLFLATSHSTLEPHEPSAASFTREGGAEAEKHVSAPEIASCQLPRNVRDSATLDETTHSSEPELFDAAYLQQMAPTSTFKLHTDAAGCFTPERLRLHARIAHQLYASAPQGLTAPRFVLLIGIPGAGKSTLLGHLELLGQLTLGDFANFDVDDVIALLPEFYHAMLNIGLGNEPIGSGDGHVSHNDDGVSVSESVRMKTSKRTDATESISRPSRSSEVSDDSFVISESSDPSDPSSTSASSSSSKPSDATSKPSHSTSSTTTTESESGSKSESNAQSHHHRHPNNQHHTTTNPHVRYQMCRDEARFILKKNLYSAIMCRRNIILHGSGKSFASYTHLLDQVTAAGFDVHVVCLDIPVETAYVRVERRSNGYGRDVPRSLVDFTASLITRNFRRLAARVPSAHLFDSTEIPPRLVWSKQQHAVAVHDAQDPVQQRYQL